MDTNSKSFLEKGRELKNDSKLGRESRKFCKVLFDDLFKSAFKKKIQERYEEFEALIINLIITRESPVIWNRNRNWFKNSPWSYDGMNIFMTKLKSAGYIDISKYYFNHNNPSNSRITRAWALPKLIEYFKNPHIRVGVNLPLVELRDINKKFIKYPPRGVATKFKNRLRIINRINKKASIVLFDKRLDTTIRAIFTEKFSYHGRLYTNGPNRFQILSEKNRSLITIDDDPIVELDFSGLHPRMLYAQENIQFDEDPYSIIHPHRNARPFLKKMLLSMINCKNFNKAQSTCNKWLNQEIIKKKTGISPIQKYQKKMMTGIGEKNFLEALKKTTSVKQLGIKTARPLMEKFLIIHKRIGKYLCCRNKTGMKLMNNDAKIALEVCSYFAKQNKVILPIHDSFIVKAEYREELMETMQRVYGKHNNGFSCPIK